MDEETLEFIEEELFPKENLKKRINIIGVGATGSRVVFNLAKMGFENIHIWDFDKVEKHNVDNQVYRVEDIGKFKVMALKEIIENSSDVKVSIHNNLLVDEESLEGIVFLLVDTMLSRKEIWKNCIRENKKVELLIETRIRQDSGDVFAFDPNNKIHIKNWEETIFKNFPLKVPRLFLINPVVEIMGGLAIFQLTKWFSLQYKKGDDNYFYFENKIKVSLKNKLQVKISSFDKKESVINKVLKLLR
jgi:molybdopterin/thiamine biosynthesis adenylyltransferase